MSLFRPKKKKRADIEIDIRRGINALRRSMNTLEKHKQSYIEKARRAKKIGDSKQFQFLKNALKNTIGEIRQRERQLLSIETALEMKEQSEADTNLAKAMQSISKSIAESYSKSDFTKMQKHFEEALTKAESLEKGIDIFLNMAYNQTLAGKTESKENMVTDVEIESLIKEEEEEEIL